MDRTLKIATWNTNGLTKQEIKTFIFSEKKNILFLKYILSTKTTFVFLTTLYHTIHSNDKERTYGGIALIIRNSVRYYEIDKYQREFLQVISVIEDWNGCIIISALFYISIIIQA